MAMQKAPAHGWTADKQRIPRGVTIRSIWGQRDFVPLTRVFARPANAVYDPSEIARGVPVWRGLRFGGVAGTLRT